MCQVFQNLKTIIVSSSFYLRATTSSFAGCTEVTLIEIPFLYEIHPNTFINNNKLQKIAIYYSTLTTLPATLFTNNPELILIYIMENYQMTSLPATLLNNNLNLKGFIIVENNLELWDPAWLKYNTQLEFMYCSDNQITSIPINAMSTNILSHLYIENQAISVLDSASFGDLSNLYRLHARNNSITAIDRRIFDQATEIGVFLGKGNQCIDEDIWRFNDHRQANIEKLRPCFEAFDVLHLGEKRRNF